MSNFSSAGRGPFDIPDSTTPPEITDEIMQLCRQLDPSQTPMYVTVRPQAVSMMDSCFFNLPEKVAAVQRQLGHRNAAYSMQYSRITAEELSNVINSR